MLCYFDLNANMNEQFRVALVSCPNGACVNVSKVLVYHYECPDYKRQSVGLTRRPETEEVSVTPRYVENSDHTVGLSCWCALPKESGKVIRHCAYVMMATTERVTFVEVLQIIIMLCNLKFVFLIPQPKLFSQ